MTDALHPPVFLAGKNTYYPDEKEIHALDEFIEKFLYGKLQNKDNYQVLKLAHRATTRILAAMGLRLAYL